jgi:hypothetical protein
VLPWSLLAGLAVLIAAGPSQAAETVGEKLTVQEPTAIAKIVADPDAYVGKRVRVEGKVTDVCPMAGCWMEIAAPEGDRLRLKVEDGVLVFPKDAPGKQAVAEGVVETIPMTREQYEDWLRHLADEKGETFDAAKVGEGPFRIVQLRGLGARIE